MNMVRVALAEGRRVMDPATLGKGAKHGRPIPAHGLMVDADAPFWFRRIRDKDVVVMTPDQIAAEEAKVAARRAAHVQELKVEADEAQLLRDKQDVPGAAVNANEAGGAGAASARASALAVSAKEE